MSWLRTLLRIVALVTLAMGVHPPSVLALIEVRSGPGMTYEVTATVPPGGSYVVVAQEQDWYKIQLPDGRQGWIHRFYAAPEQSPTQSAPVVATPPATLSPMAPPAASAMPSKAQPLAFTPSRPGETSTAPLWHTGRLWSLATRRMRKVRCKMPSRMRRISRRCCTVWALRSPSCGMCPCRRWKRPSMRSICGCAKAGWASFILPGMESNWTERTI